jgi:hypothetical protein
MVFRPHLQPSPRTRFNVTTCDNPQILRWLEQVAAQKGSAEPRQAAESSVPPIPAVNSMRWW